MGIGMRELLVILVVALLVFGTKKLKTIGSDLGGAVRGFKKAMEEGEAESERKPAPTEPVMAAERRIESEGAAGSNAGAGGAAAAAAKKDTVA
jgi:TatA/E family protein of Tat protein translocase